MRRMIVPVLAAGLLSLAGCSAAEETGSAPDAPAAETTSAEAAGTEAASGAPAADLVDAELRTITIDVMGMG